MTTVKNIGKFDRICRIIVSAWYKSTCKTSVPKSLTTEQLYLSKCHAWLFRMISVDLMPCAVVSSNMENSWSPLVFISRPLKLHDMCRAFGTDIAKHSKRSVSPMTPYWEAKHKNVLIKCVWSFARLRLVAKRSLMLYLLGWWHNSWCLL